MRQVAAALLILIIVPAKCQFESCVEEGVGYTGKQIRTTTANTPDGCQQACQSEDRCKHWTWKKPTKQCTLFETEDKLLEFQDVDESFEVSDVVSGPKICKGTSHTIRPFHIAPIWL